MVVTVAPVTGGTLPESGGLLPVDNGECKRRLSTALGGPYGIDASAHRLLEGRFGSADRPDL
jgi:hypothetical protein